jgi:hypothetical protein
VTHKCRTPSHLFALLSAFGTALLSAVAVAAPTQPTAPIQPIAAAAQRATDAGESGRAFATLKLPKRPPYVGESVPITLNAYYSAGTSVTITGAPTVNSADFTLSLGEPAQSRALIGGEPYLAVTWKGHVSPVKPGHFDLDVQIPSTLEWRAAPVRSPSESDEDPFGDLFGGLDSLGINGDPFAAMQQNMQRLMNQALHRFDAGALQKRTVALQSKKLALEVEPLPALGRPTAFSGAVGHFSLEASITDPRVRAGEPVELSLAVSGDGNFDRVTTAGVPSSANFESYSPTSSQTAGAKKFTQPIVPRAAGHVEIPAVELAYFDPDAHRYVTARSQPIALDVDPGAALAASLSGSVPNATSGPTLAPNSVTDGRTVASLRPIYTRRLFWFAQLAPLGALAAAFSFARWRQRVTADPHRGLRASAHRALRRHSAEVEAAFAAGDAPAFFAAARAALQQRLGALWGVTPEAITLVEIEQRVRGPELDTLRSVFDADADRFGPGAAPRELAVTRTAVRHILAQPEIS